MILVKAIFANLKPFILSLLFLLHCHEYGSIDHTDPGFSISRGLMLYHGSPFTGKMIQKNPTLDETFITTYRNGLEDGEYTARKGNGQLLEQRFYLAGEKHGIHRTWYDNGNNRSYAEFMKGKYINESWSWYENGKPAKLDKYNEKGDILATKVWNRLGIIYMNLSFNPDGSSAGLPGSKICEPIKSKRH